MFVMRLECLLLTVCMFMVEIAESYAIGRCSVDVINLNAVILRNVSTNLEFIVPQPQSGKLELNHGEKIIFACPGVKNHVKFEDKKNYTALHCVTNNTFLLNGISVDFNDISCNKKISVDIRKTTTKCSRNNGEILEIGYKITRRNFVKFIDICYDSNVVVPLYVEHYIYGNNIKHFSKNVGRPSFSNLAIPRDASYIHVVYKKAFQKATFNKLLKNAQIAETYINNNSMLQKGHLAPKADFLYESWQNGTFFYINTAPQWNSINNGNWKSLEGEIRNVSSLYYEPLRIVTGTLGVLSLKDINNNDINIYLNESKSIIPVPKYFWKIVYEPTHNSGIVFTCPNNPFYEEPTLCGSPDFCTVYKWGSTSWNNLRTGRISCCTLQEFKSIAATAKRTLQGPN